MTAADLAAILDPEHLVEGWWRSHLRSLSGAMLVAPIWRFTGPDDLHTAREHAWRIEDWLEARGYEWRRFVNRAGDYNTCTFDIHGEILTQDKDHTAALVAAVERIAK